MVPFLVVVCGAFGGVGDDSPSDVCPCDGGWCWCGDCLFYDSGHCLVPVDGGFVSDDEVVGVW